MATKWHKGECVLASGALSSDGYGKRKIGGKTLRAHRVAYCEHHGVSLQDIAGLVIMHRCDNRACVNPQHLAIGSHQENMRDMVSKGRAAKGERCGRAKLSAADVEAIRRDYVPRSRSASAAVIATRYGVSRRCVASIVERRTWRHI